MSTATRMFRPEAVEIARRFIELIDGTYEQLYVAGSLRRMLGYIGDIEIVAVPKVEPADYLRNDLFGAQVEQVEVDRLDTRLNVMLTEDTVSKRLDANGSPRWGPTLKYLMYQGARVDLFCPCAERLGWILMLRTGPAAFSRQLVVPRDKRTKDRRRGLLPLHVVPKDGWLTWRTSGERIPTPDERTVFELLGLPCQDPWERV